MVNNKDEVGCGCLISILGSILLAIVIGYFIGWVWVVGFFGLCLVVIGLSLVFG